MKSQLIIIVLLNAQQVSTLQCIASQTLNIMLIGLIYFATLIDVVEVHWSLFVALMLFTCAVVVVIFTLTAGSLQCSNSALLNVCFHLPRSGIV
ncbi:hypothetical protein T12_4823 [Trichinella patagoniensis]|uniref:Uncharacterized protein n=1 Tax=Trichinella patagoniensis TaxID=990121 RepID=A0A0V1ACI9_9BILA|nr:hypothetical protein T12_4823 [Trichinella patagoniensis]